MKMAESAPFFSQNRTISSSGETYEPSLFHYVQDSRGTYLDTRFISFSYTRTAGAVEEPFGCQCTSFFSVRRSS